MIRITHCLLIFSVLLTSCVSTEVNVMGTLSGTVKDASTNAPIKNCSVENIETSVKVKTDANGYFNFGEMEVGEYTLSLSALNYMSTKSSVIVETGKETRKDFVLQKISVPTSFTDVPSSITHNSATLRGKIVNDGGSDIVTRGFMFGESEQDLIEFKVETTNDSFEYSISELKPNTEYYVMAYSINAHGTGYGELISFQTKDSQTSVVTYDATDITHTEATLHAEFYLTSVDDLKEIGFYYGLTSDDLSKKVVASFSGSVDFYVILTGLLQETTYFFKAYVTTKEETISGDVLQFTTLSVSAPKITSQSFCELKETSVILNAEGYVDGTDKNVEYGFYIGESEIYQGEKEIVGVGELSSFSCKINWLEKGQTYYYVPYAKNSKGTTKGKVEKFTTPEYNGHEYIDLGLPSGTKWASCNVGAKSAIDKGTIFKWASNIAGEEWGGTWRQPTLDEIKELVEHCSRTYHFDSSYRYWTEWGGPNGKKIILPENGAVDGNGTSIDTWSGVYWSSQVSGKKAYVLKTGQYESDFWAEYPVGYKAYVRPVSH